MLGNVATQRLQPFENSRAAYARLREVERVNAAVDRDDGQEGLHATVAAAECYNISLRDVVDAACIKPAVVVAHVQLLQHIYRAAAALVHHRCQRPAGDAGQVVVRQEQSAERCGVFQALAQLAHAGVAKVVPGQVQQLQIAARFLEHAPGSSAGADAETAPLQPQRRDVLVVTDARHQIHERSLATCVVAHVQQLQPRNRRQRSSDASDVRGAQLASAQRPEQHGWGQARPVHGRQVLGDLAPKRIFAGVDRLQGFVLREGFEKGAEGLGVNVAGADAQTNQKLVCFEGCGERD